MHGEEKGLDRSNAYRWKVPTPSLFIMGLGNSSSCVMLRSHFNWMHWCMANTLNLSNGNWSSCCFCCSHCDYWGLDFCLVCHLHFSKNKAKEQGSSICSDSFQNRPVASKFPWCKTREAQLAGPNPQELVTPAIFPKPLECFCLVPPQASSPLPLPATHWVGICNLGQRLALFP